jgi:hypothetical protein
MVRSQERTQERLLAYLRSVAYQRQRSVVFLPSVGWIATRSEQSWHVVDNCLDHMDLIGAIAVSRTPKGLWIDLEPQNAY